MRFERPARNPRLAARIDRRYALRVPYAIYLVGFAVAVGSVTGTALHGQLAFAGFVAGVVIFCLGIVVEERRYKPD